MSFIPNSHRKRRAGLPGAVLACAAGVILLVFPFGNGLKRWSFDLLAALKPTQPIDDLVLIYIDDISHTKLNQPYDAPWNRELDAKLVERLQGFGARAIGFDVLFDQPGTSPASDAAFAGAIRKHGGVALGATISRGDYFGLATELQLKLPVSNLVSAAQGWGFIELPVDPDDTIRLHNAGPEDIPSLSWRMAKLLGAPVTAAEGSQRLERWMNYYGSGDVIPGVSYFKVLDEMDSVPASFFQNKIVIVGAGSKSGYTGKRKDQFRNPYTWLTGRFSPGAEVHATALLNLLRGDWLRRPAWWTELAIVMLWGAGAGFGLARFRPSTAVAVGLIAMLASAGLCWLWMIAAQVWFGWMILALVQIPVALACAVIAGQQTSPAASDPAATREFNPEAQSPITQPHIPDYELLQTLGRGAYGEVWLARSVTGVLRAVKIVHKRGFERDEQFEREFQGVVNFEPVSRLHPGLVSLLHAGRNDGAGFFYYVMELADCIGTDGSTSTAEFHEGSRYLPNTLLAHTSRGDALPPRICLRIATELASAISFLHERGLVHRDIKPANIIFVNGHAKLADVGLVAEIGEARTFVGTAGYIPMEGPGTPQADVYGAGKVLYELLTGWRCERFPETPSPPPEAGDAVLWGRLMKVIRRACARDLDQRFASAREMLETLESAKTGE